MLLQTALSTHHATAAAQGSHSHPVPHPTSFDVSGMFSNLGSNWITQRTFGGLQRTLASGGLGDAAGAVAGQDDGLLAGWGLPFVGLKFRNPDGSESGVGLGTMRARYPNVLARTEWSHFWEGVEPTEEVVFRVGRTGMVYKNPWDRSTHKVSCNSMHECERWCQETYNPHGSTVSGHSVQQGSSFGGSSNVRHVVNEDNLRIMKHCERSARLQWPFTNLFEGAQKLFFGLFFGQFPESSALPGLSFAGDYNGLAAL